MTVRSALVHLAVIATPIAVVLVAFEVALRLAGYDPVGEATTSGRLSILRESANPDIIYELTPNSSGYTLDSRVEVNSLGFRGREPEVTAPEGVRRVIAIGDSITFGYGLPVDASYPSLLEERLRRAGEAVDVLNLGVAGYDTAQEVAQLEYRGLQFQPDLVVLGYSLNDAGLGRNAREDLQNLGRYQSLLYRVRTVQFVRRFASRSRNWLARNWLSDMLYRQNEREYRERYQSEIQSVSDDTQLIQLMQALEHNLQADAVRSWRTLWLKQTARTWPDIRWYTSQARVGRLRHAFDRLKELSDAHGFAVVVVIFPYLDDAAWTEHWQLVYQIIKHEASRLNFKTVDVYDDFRAHGLANIRLRPYDNDHPNALGHKLIADRLSPLVLAHVTGETATRAVPQTH